MRPRLDFAEFSYRKGYEALFSLPEFQALGWAAQLLYFQLWFRLVGHHTGRLPIGALEPGLAVAIALGEKSRAAEIREALSELTAGDPPFAVVDGDGILLTGYVEAQEASQSDAARARQHRAKARVGRSGNAPSVTPRDSSVTKRDANVTRDERDERDSSSSSLPQPGHQASSSSGEGSRNAEPDAATAATAGATRGDNAATARQLLDEYNAVLATVFPGSDPFPATKRNLRGIEQRLADGYTVEQCRRAIAVHVEDIHSGDEQAAANFLPHCTFTEKSFDKKLRRLTSEQGKKAGRADEQPDNPAFRRFKPVKRPARAPASGERP